MGASLGNNPTFNNQYLIQVKQVPTRYLNLKYNRKIAQPAPYLIDDDCAVGADEGRVEVEDDVDEEGQVDDGVDDQERDVVVVETPVEGQVERNHHDGVESQAEDQPVPDNLENNGGHGEQVEEEGEDLALPLLHDTPPPASRYATH